MSPKAVEKQSVMNERDSNMQSIRTQAFISSNVVYQTWVELKKGFYK